MVLGAILQASSQNVGTFIGARCDHSWLLFLFIYLFIYLYISFLSLSIMQYVRFLSRCLQVICALQFTYLSPVGCGSAFATNSAPV